MGGIVRVRVLLVLAVAIVADAYHRLVLDAQERLTPEQQQAWARALLPRRTAEERLQPNVR